jgi:beta-galactosidase
MEAGNPLGMEGEFQARHFCELLHCRGARQLASYGEDFYAGRPALTVNSVGDGEAYYLASRNDDAFLGAFYERLIERRRVGRAIPKPLPAGVTARVRSNGRQRFLFLMNFSPESQVVEPEETPHTDVVSGEKVGSQLTLEPYGYRVLAR